METVIVVMEVIVVIRTISDGLYVSLCRCVVDDLSLLMVSS